MTTKSHHFSSNFLGDICYLFGKIILVAGLLLAIYTFIFGLTRYPNAGMAPAIKSGDLGVYYRLDKSYQIGDVLAFDFENKTQFARVVATAGDTVDITDKGLYINGNRQQEEGILGETLLYKTGATFPLKVPKNHVFVLGDNRPEAMDSRIFGALSIDDSKGKVVMLLRRRSL